MDFTYAPRPHIRSYHPRPRLDHARLAEAAALINNAKRPFILAGHGIQIARAHEIFREFVEKSGIPVAMTIHGLGSLPHGHPLNMGMLGMH